MKKVTKIIIGSIAAVAVALGVSGFAMAKHHGDMGGYMMYKLEKKLDLNESQMANLKAAAEFMQAQRQEHMQADYKTQMKELLAQPALDQAKIIGMMEEKMQQMRANAPEMIGKVAAFTDSLTPEQRAELTQMMDKMSKRGRHHQGH